ncbi:non-lysosomal glucosylceramidase [Clonorchis sinensis]|uniref:Non-lysosomal glucosylceramidase n=1 Tax=Clonorchis sinensis TaxID=79923 RepID=G7YSK1_CLOSI|nr:non-lysosomal glucosylceramidase [Clonorchis sinensis]
MSVETDQNVIQVLENLGAVSKHGWKARFDRKPEVQCKPFGFPRLSQIKSFIPMAFRYTFRFYLRKRLIEKRLPFLDPSQHVPWKPIYGVPMGGIGCGAIGRGFRGEFVRSSLIPGMYSYDPQPADQFILTIRKGGETLFHQVLSPQTSVPAFANGLRSWNWGFSAQHAHYIGLYPRSWTVYEVAHFNLILVCHQVSPVLPHDYKASCLPTCVFVWTVFNFGSEALEVTISFSWHGPSPAPRSAPNSNNQVSNHKQPNGLSSVELTQPLVKEPVADYLSARIQFAMHLLVGPSGYISYVSGYTITNWPTLRRRTPKLAVMVSATCIVPPARSANASAGDLSEAGQSQLEFAVVWHSPLVWFRGNKVIYRRRYARWFPEPGMLGAERLLESALSNWKDWVERIEQWQNPVLHNSSFPDWYKSALFNELYYLTDGGTVWLDPNHHGGADFKWQSWKYRSRVAQEMGLFAYLEGHEYRMYNTLDVHYNSSWALIKLWPKLQLAVLLDCADLAIEEDQTQLYFIHQGRYGIRSTESAVPHDFGDPEGEPWRDANAYVMYPTKDWKDLNPKFVLQVWRDWKLTQDNDYLLYMLPIVNRIIQVSLQSWDSNGDGMIENSGFPDQTYDTWNAQGISAYTGGLWLACLYSACEMLEYALSANSPLKAFLIASNSEDEVSWPQVQKELQILLESAKTVYDRALWTGTYYIYQNTPVGNHEAIMADQLSGHGFLRVGGAPPGAILPSEHVIMALKTIQSTNWESIQNGSLGVINGGLPGAKRDLSNVQAEEFWVGVNYSLAATMILEGMSQEGFSLAEACYNTIYNRFGLQYQTPEAYMIDGRFRCPGYMRPLAIWSIQQALETKQLCNGTTSTNSLQETEDDEMLTDVLSKSSNISTDGNHTDVAVHKQVVKQVSTSQIGRLRFYLLFLLVSSSSRSDLPYTPLPKRTTLFPILFVLPSVDIFWRALFFYTAVTASPPANQCQSARSFWCTFPTVLHMRNSENSQFVLEINVCVGYTKTPVLKRLDFTVIRRLACLCDSLNYNGGTKILDPSTFSQSITPSLSTRNRGDPEATVAGCVRAGVVPINRAEGSLLDWIPVDSRLYAVRLAKSVRSSAPCLLYRLTSSTDFSSESAKDSSYESYEQEVDRCPFVVPAHVPIGCSSDTIKDDFQDVLRALKQLNITNEGFFWVSGGKAADWIRQALASDVDRDC